MIWSCNRNCHKKHPVKKIHCHMGHHISTVAKCTLWRKKGKLLNNVLLTLRYDAYNCHIMLVKLSYINIPDPFVFLYWHSWPIFLRRCWPICFLRMLTHLLMGQFSHLFFKDAGPFVNGPISNVSQFPTYSTEHIKFSANKHFKLI
jgi:hypothetical protein